MLKIRDAINSLANNDIKKAIEIYKELKNEYCTSGFDLTISYLEKKAASEAAQRRETPARFSEGYSSLFEALGVEVLYVVSMRSQIERRMRVLRNLSELEISHLLRFVDGVEGYCDPDARLLFQNYLQRECNILPSSKHIEPSVQQIMKRNATVGTFGYLLSQKKVFEDALRLGYRRICIFDDDAFFSDQFDLQLTNFVIRNQLPDDFLIFHLGASEYSEEYPIDSISKNVPKLYSAIPHKTCGSFATVYDCKSFKLILDAINEFDGPYDNVALGSIYSRYPDRCYVITPNVCAADVQTSAIRNGRDQFIHSKKMRWNFTREAYDEFTKPLSINIIVRDASSISADLMRRGRSKFLQLKFFYCSPDGIRPLHSTRSADLSNREGGIQREFDLIYTAVDSENLPHVLPRLPDADFSILWPSAVELTTTELVDAYISHLDLSIKSNNFSTEFKTFAQNFSSKTVKGRVSVVIPVARAFDLVRPSIVSVIQQEYSDIELIIVFDSPAKLDLNFIENVVRAEIKKYGQQNLTFKIIQHSQVRYGCGARNTGLFNSSGEYICFLDDDDLYLPGRLSSAIDYLESDSGLGFGACYCGYNGLWSPNEGEDLSRYREGNLFFDLLALQYKSHFVHTGTMTYRARNLYMLQGFDEKYKRHQDIELNARYFRHWRAGCVKSVGMLFKPNRGKIKPTVVMDFELMLCIKKYIFEDFKAEINGLDEKSFALLLDAHAADLVALSPSGDRLGKLSSISVLKSFLV